MLAWPVRRILAPVFIGVLVLVIGLSAAVCVLGLIHALVDRRARLLRLAALAGVYAAMEVVALVLMLVVWMLRVVRIVDEAADQRAVAWALGVILGAARLICGFEVELEEPPSLGPFEQADPVLVLARHGGVGDSFALAHLLLTRYRRQPRIVLKRTLQWDPMIDVALTRLGACWIGGPGRRSAREGIGSLAADLRPGEAMLLFPEGKNWTPGRRASLLAHLRRSGSRWAMKEAALMEHVLPPKAGGVLASLDARPDITVLVFAHTGLDRITSLRDLWQALPFEVPMRVRWWLAAPAPLGEDDRQRWLTTEWAVVDQWIDGASPVNGAIVEHGLLQGPHIDHGELGRATGRDHPEPA